MASAQGSLPTRSLDIVDLRLLARLERFRWPYGAMETVRDHFSFSIVLLQRVVRVWLQRRQHGGVRLVIKMWRPSNITAKHPLSWCHLFSRCTKSIDSDVSPEEMMSPEEMDRYHRTFPRLTSGTSKVHCSYQPYQHGDTYPIDLFEPMKLSAVAVRPPVADGLLCDRSFYDRKVPAPPVLIRVGSQVGAAGIGYVLSLPTPRVNSHKLRPNVARSRRRSEAGFEDRGAYMTGFHT
jgi:hypothetical protein